MHSKNCKFLWRLPCPPCDRTLTTRAGGTESLNTEILHNSCLIISTRTVSAPRKKENMKECTKVLIPCVFCCCCCFLMNQCSVHLFLVRVMVGISLTTKLCTPNLLKVWRCHCQLSSARKLHCAVSNHCADARSLNVSNNAQYTTDTV